MTKWIPFNYDNINKLEDHHFYLVATTFLNVPVVAKYHSDGSPHFEIMPYGGNVFYICDPEITHFMELPKMPSKEEQEYRNERFLGIPFPEDDEED